MLQHEHQQRQECGTPSSSAPTARTAAISTLGAHPLLGLQRQAGNRAVTRTVLAVQRDHTNNPDEFIDWIKRQPHFKVHAKKDAQQAKNSCHAAAGLVELAIRNTPVRRSARVYFTWKKGSWNPGDHLVVVATVAGQHIIVDPTRQQFGLRPDALREQDWEQEFLQAISADHGIAARDFDNVGDASEFVTDTFDPFSEATPWRKDDPSSIGARLIRARARGKCVIL